MYELSSQWLQFYQELSPAARRQLFETLQINEPDDGANELRLKLLKTRYQDPRHPEHEVDNLLWQCLNLPYLYKRGRYFKKSAAKEVTKTFRELSLNEALSYGEAGEKAVYWEVRNAVRRYFSTCQGEHYRRKVFGVMRASEEERQNQILKDAWQMSYGLAHRLGLEAETALFCQAVRDEYATLSADAGSDFDAREQQALANMK
ncbi:MAG: hypothetical protein PHR21_04695 [Oscillospiraceae bacterium]|nr:hypothetical protein [Oscillospiraceae bacterium]MDD4369018.1 hypothetical protein [Oscillospiraceae bacterium]